MAKAKRERRCIGLVHRTDGVHIFQYESESDPMGPTHDVHVHPDGRVICGCRGFSTPTKCWHVQHTARLLGRTLDISTWGAKLGPEDESHHKERA